MPAGGACQRRLQASTCCKPQQLLSAHQVRLAVFKLYVFAGHLLLKLQDLLLQSKRGYTAMPSTTGWLSSEVLQLLQDACVRAGLGAWSTLP